MDTLDDLLYLIEKLQLKEDKRNLAQKRKLAFFEDNLRGTPS
jgi:hypothetical protein